MTDYSERYRRPSPRTPDKPMAFTSGEFARGAGVALLAFNVLAPVTMTVWMLLGSAIRGEGLGSQLPYLVAVPLYTVILAVPWSIGALVVVGGPWAFLLGTALRRIPAFGPHHSSFALLGAAVGAGTIMLQRFFDSMPEPGVTIAHMVVQSPWASMDWLMVALMAVTTSVAVVFGWRWTAKRALRADSLREREEPALP